MNLGLYQGAAAMRASEKRLNALAHNLANVSTPGFKRHGTAARIFRVEEAGRVRQGLRTELTTDWSQGNLDRTENPYDLALFGEGFFAVEAPHGEVYTRAGSFKLNDDGVLQTMEGYPVAWAQRIGDLDPRGGPVVVDGEGNVRQGTLDVGRLKLTDFEDRTRLRQDGQGYWMAPAGAQEKAYTAVVHQGAVERSNATGLEELISMVMVQRSFDASSRVLSMINQSYQRLTRESR